MNLQHVRHKRFSRVRRSQHLLTFLAERAATLGATGTARTIASKVTFSTGTLTFGANAGNGKVVIVGDKTYTFKTNLTEVVEVRATGTLTASTNFIENDTVTITAGTAKVYVFKDAPNTNGLQVAVGTDLTTSLLNLKVAVNAMNDGVQTTSSATQLLVTANVGLGAAANAYGTVVGSNTGNGTWAATTLLGGVSYVAPVAAEVKISAVNASGSLDNLIAAVNGAAGVATTYSTGTVANTYATALAGNGDTVDFTAITIGDPGNAVATTTDVTSASWGAATLVGGYSVSKYATSLLTYGANAVAADVLTIGTRTYTFVTALTEVIGVAASGVLTASQNFVADDTVTIRTIVYTFKPLANTSGLQVTVGHSLERSLQDLAFAVNSQANGVTATSDATKLYVTATATGTAANSYATTDVATYASWGNSVLQGGIAAVAPVVDEIKVSAATKSATLDNVAAAINGTAGVGVVYSTGSTPSTDVTVTPTNATGTASFSAAGTTDDTLTVGGVTYTMKAAYASTANLVVIGATATATRDNFLAAINAGTGNGTLYGSSTVVNPQVSATATVVGGVPALLFTAKATGTVGNAFTLTEASTAITVTGAGTLAGATDTLSLTARTIGVGGNLIATVTNTASATFPAAVMSGGFTENQLTCTSHALQNGDGPFILSTTGTLPASLQLSTSYWVFKAATASSLSLATSRDNINEAVIADKGTGTHTMTRLANAFSVFEAVRKNGSAAVVAATDVNTL